MKTAIAAFSLLAGTCFAANAQEPVYGVTLGNVQAVRDADRNQSAITGMLANLSARPVSNAMLTFVLYDAQGREVGRLRNDVPGPLAPGEIKQIRAVTPLQFTRVTALDVAAQ